MKIPIKLQAKFPETIPGAKGRQCEALRDICRVCGKRYFNNILTDGSVEAELECKECQTPRTRCGNFKSDNDLYCRVHNTTRPLGIYTLLAGVQADISFGDILEQDSRDLSPEFALARVSLMEMLARDPDKRPTAEVLLPLIEKFFVIAERRKKLEDGNIVAINFDDAAAAEVRKQVRRCIRAFADALSESMIDQKIKAQIIQGARDRMRNLGGPRNTAVMGLHKQSELKGREDGMKELEEGVGEIVEAASGIIPDLKVPESLTVEGEVPQDDDDPEPLI